MEYYSYRVTSHSTYTCLVNPSNIVTAALIVEVVVVYSIISRTVVERQDAVVRLFTELRTCMRKLLPADWANVAPYFPRWVSPQRLHAAESTFSGRSPSLVHATENAKFGKRCLPTLLF